MKYTNINLINLLFFFTMISSIDTKFIYPYNLRFISKSTSALNLSDYDETNNI